MSRAGWTHTGKGGVTYRMLRENNITIRIGEIITESFGT
jgi:hypothetical protein